MFSSDGTQKAVKAISKIAAIKRMDCRGRTQGWERSDPIRSKRSTTLSIRSMAGIGSGFRSVSIDWIGLDRSDLVHAMLGSLDRFRAILKVCSVRIDQIGGVAYKSIVRRSKLQFCMLHRCKL